MPLAYKDDEITESSPLDKTARYMARQLGILFKSHDQGHRKKAVKSCKKVDGLQFQHLDQESIEIAATAFVDALWEKNNIELEYLQRDGFDTDGIRNADYSSVKKHLRKRAVTIGADPDYATNKAKAWRLHKAGGDYWTPYLKAQKYEFRAAIQDPNYPRKPRNGLSGPGPAPMRYVLASELHDMRTADHWEQGVKILTPYFMYILEEHDHDTSE